MGSYTIGVFVASTDTNIMRAAKRKWDFVNVKKVEMPYVGYAIYGHDTAHCSLDRLEKMKHENNRLIQELASLSKHFRNETFVFMEEDEHGILSSHQGIVYKNGNILLNEMGDWREISNRFEEELKSGEFNIYRFQSERLGRLLRYLGIKSGKNVYFELFN